MTNKENFLKLVSRQNSETEKDILLHQKNKSWLRESKRIAVKVLLALKEQNMTQKELAEKMGVSPQYINKLVKGKENLTLDTITKLQNILQIAILTSANKLREENGYKVQAFSYQADYQKECSKYSPSNLKVTVS